MTIATKTGFDQNALRRLPATSEGERRLRREALRTFRALPVPSQETEEWRYTDLSELDLNLTPFLPGTGRVDSLDGVPEHVQGALGDLGERAGLHIQLNSEVVLSRLGKEADARDVHFESLDDALRDHPELVEPYLHALVPPDRTRFSALHAAFRTGGTFVLVPKGVRVELPLQTLTFVDRDGLAVFPHTLIVLEEGAELTYIDRYTSPDLGRVLSDAAVELFLGPGASLRYVALQEWGSGVTHLSVQRARVGRDARLSALGVAFGGSLARAEVEAVLAEDGGSSELLGIYFGDDEQHIDHRSIQDHVGSRTASDLLYKGALKGRSRAVYTGTVIIEKGAHRCDAYQTNRNILLSDHAKAHSVPNLEILTNDPTRCGHAASVGPVSDDELFYLMSRGIPREEAERLIVFGFFREVLDRVPLEEIRAGLERAIEAELAKED